MNLTQRQCHEVKKEATRKIFDFHLTRVFSDVTTECKCLFQQVYL